MRPTRAGWGAIGLSGLAFFAAASTGNNLLYLMFAAAAASLFLSWAFGRWSLRQVEAKAEAPAQAFRGVPASAYVTARAAGAWTARLVRVVGPGGTAELGDLEPGRERRVELKLVLPHRGRNLVDGLALETSFPFGLLVARRPLPPFEAVALPPASPFAVQARIETDPRAGGRDASGARRGGRDGEFWGPRPYSIDDDARLIHWKLTAKSGKPVVAVHAAGPEGKVVVSLESEDEAAVERAAAACRWFVDSGAETGLAGPGVDVAPARGLEQLDKLLRALALVGAGGAPRRAASAAPARDDGPADSPALRRLTLFVLVLVYLAMFLIDETDARGLLALAPAVPAGLWLHERGGPFPPARLWSVLSAAVLAFLVFFDWKWSGVALANAHLLAYLLFNRLLNPWSRAELRQVFLIIFLAFVLVSGLTINPWYFPLYVAWLISSAAWLMLQNGAPPARARSWAPSLASVLLAGAAFSVLVFLAAPRVDSLRRFNPFTATVDKLKAQAQAVMGFTDRVSLGHYGTIRRSSARVMRVAPADGSPRPDGLYVRGSALDRFDGRAWTKAPLDFHWRSRGKTMKTDRGRAWVPRVGREMSLPVIPGEDEGDNYAFTVFPMQLSVLFTVGGAWFVDGFEDNAFFDHTGSLLPAAPYNTGTQYTLRALPDGRYPTDAATDLAARARAAALVTPADPGGKVAALAAKWTAGRTDPLGKARAIGERFAREYSYSTYSDGRGTALEDFLFDVKRGNCEYFATAAAVLLRHAGVPARLAAGFHATTWNEYGRFYDVRQSDAHAWVEVEVPGKGWVVFDPTPAQSGFAASAEALFERLGRWADAAQTAWYRRVVGYDQYAQRDALSRFGFGRGFSQLGAALGRWLRLAFVLAAFLGAAGLLARAYSAWRRGADEYERAEAALARAGLSRAPWQTPREFARDVARRRPELAAVAELAEDHYNRRWGGVQPDAGARARARRLLASIKERI